MSAQSLGETCHGEGLATCARLPLRQHQRKLASPCPRRFSLFGLLSLSLLGVAQTHLAENVLRDRLPHVTPQDNCRRRVAEKANDGWAVGRGGIGAEAARPTEGVSL